MNEIPIQKKNRNGKRNGMKVRTLNPKDVGAAFVPMRTRSH